MVVISGISLAFCLVLVAIICALLCIKTVKNMREGSLLQKLAQNAHMLQSYFVLTVTLYFSFLLNAKLYIGDCTAETNAFLGYFCVHIG